MNHWIAYSLILFSLYACNSKTSQSNPSPSPTPTYSPQDLPNIGGMSTTATSSTSETGVAKSAVEQLLCNLPIGEEIFRMGSQAWMMAKSASYGTAAIQNVTDTTSLTIFPSSPRTFDTTTPRDSVKVVSWNVHHGFSANQSNVCFQMDDMIAKMVAQNADVYLLQEVNPWDKEKIANGLGYQGLFSFTTPANGNMILVRPDWQVSDQKSRVLNYDVSGNLIGATLMITDWAQMKGKPDPRSAQMAVIMKGNTSFRVWNTQMPTTGECGDSCLQTILPKLTSLIDMAGSGLVTLGGGDMSSGTGSFTINQLSSQGYGLPSGVTGSEWIFTKNAKFLQINSITHTNTAGQDISGSPMISAEIYQ